MGKLTSHSLTTVQTNQGSVTIPRLYIVIVFTVDFQLGTLFCVRSLRSVFVYHWKKAFLKLIFRVIEVIVSQTDATDVLMFESWRLHRYVVEF